MKHGMSDDLRMLVGEYRVFVEPDGRLAVPEPWRKAIGRCCCAIPDEKGLRVIPSDVVMRRLEKSRVKALTDPGYLHALEVVGRSSQMVEISEGRVELDKCLLERMKIAGEAMLIGKGEEFLICAATGAGDV